MAAKKPETHDPLSFTVTLEQKNEKRPMVDIFLPEIHGAGGDMKVDQYEHVTIANEEKETCWKVLRGETVSVPVEVYMVLKEKYPKL